METEREKSDRGDRDRERRNVGTQTPIKTVKYLFKSISLLSMVTVFGGLDGFFQG